MLGLPQIKVDAALKNICGGMVGWGPKSPDSDLREAKDRQSPAPWVKIRPLINPWEPAKQDPSKINHRG